MRIAKPMLLVSTPLGVIFGIHEAFKVGTWLGSLMIALIAVVSGFFALTVRRIRAERDERGRHPRG